MSERYLDIIIKVKLFTSNFKNLAATLQAGILTSTGFDFSLKTKKDFHNFQFLNTEMATFRSIAVN